MAHSKYSYSNKIKEVEEGAFECTSDFTEPRFRRDRIDVNDLEHKNASVRWLVPMNSTLNYFECEITSKTDTGYGIWIGIGPWSEDSQVYSEMLEYGLCYEADSGHVYIGGAYRAQGYKEQEAMCGLTCTSGDRIGCGIDFDSSHHSGYIHVFFTINGKQVGDLIRCKMPPFRICPVVGMGEKGQQICFLQHCNRPSLLSAVKRSDTVVLRAILNLECSEAPPHDSPNSNVIVAFQEACSLGLDDIVQIFFEYTGNDLITKKGANGKFNGLNALQIATMNRRNLVVQTLLRRDGSKRAHREKDEEGCTPLLVAAKNGDKVTLGSLLEHISQLVVAEDEQNTEDSSRSKDTDPVHTCGGRVTENASENQREMVEIIAAASSEDTGANLLQMKPLKLEGSSQEHQGTDSEVHIIFSPSEDDSNKQKDQPIIQKKELAEVEKLRRQHPDIFEEVCTEELQSHKNIMHLAAENGHGNVIKVLWSHNYSNRIFIALMTRTDKDGNTPFHLCCKYGHTAVIQEFFTIFEEDGVLKNANRYCVQREGLKETTYFNLLNMEDINPSDYSYITPAGYSPMHLACLHGHEEAFKLLFDSKYSSLHIVNQYEQTLLHVAAAGGHMKIIEMLIDAQANIAAKDIANKTPLHLAARNGRVEAVRFLMEITCDQAKKKATSTNKKANKNAVEDTDENSSTTVEDDDDNEEELYTLSYLDEAILNGQREVVDVIISNQKLDDLTYSEKTLPLLVKQMPDAAKSVLDSCIKPINWKTDYCRETCEVEFNYDLLKRRLGKTPKREYFPKRFKRKQSPKKTTYGWKGFLQSLKKSEKEELIKHPIVEGLIHSIWKQKYRWIYYFFLLLHVIFVIMLTCLALLLNNPTSSTCELILSGQYSNLTVKSEVNISLIPDKYSDTVVEYFMSKNVTVTDDLANISSNDLCSSAAAPIRDILTTFTSVEVSCAPECGIKNSILVFMRALAVMLIVISALKILSELVQLLHSCCEPSHYRRSKYWWLYLYYLTDLVNWLELPLYVFTIIFASSQLNSQCTCIQSWQWSIGIAALFLAWASLILFLRKLELFDTGIYVLMFEILVRRFLKTVILTSLLVVMFALTFYLSFNQINPSFVRSPFSSIFTSLWKMMTMITGEMDYESIFRQSSSGTEDPDPPLPFPEISYLLWIVFLIMIPILLNNLLTGLAVDDIKEILNTAEVRKLKSKIDLIVSMNAFFFIWATLILYVLLPVILIVTILLSCFCACFICPCLFCYIFNNLYHDRDVDMAQPIANVAGWYFSFFEFLFEEREPKISTTIVHPFKPRSPFSASKRYKSPENLVKIIEKPSSEEKAPDLLKVMEIRLLEKMESCLKEEVESCVREKLQHCLFEEMKRHFKQMEDNVVMKVEQTVRMSKNEKQGVSDSPIDGGKEV